MTAAGSGDLVAVRVLRLPVAVYAEAQQHGDELLREFALITQERGIAKHEVPARLTALVDELTATYSGFTTEQETILAQAVADGATEVSELAFLVPAEAGDASRRLGELLDEADRYCREGRYLLTLATPPRAKQFRDWYLGEFIRQTNGEPPMSWPEFAEGQ